MLALWCQASLATEWGYEGDSGPDHWASLDRANVTLREVASPSRRLIWLRPSAWRKAGW